MENFKCLFCGGDLIRNSDAPAYETSSVHDEEDTAIASYYTCSVCGRDYEIVEPTEEERNTDYRKYWIDKER